jgi:hypothetical protein
MLRAGLSDRPCGEGASGRPFKRCYMNTQTNDGAHMRRLAHTCADAVRCSHAPMLQAPRPPRLCLPYPEVGRSARWRAQWGVSGAGAVIGPSSAAKRRGLAGQEAVACVKRRCALARGRGATADRARHRAAGLARWRSRGARRTGRGGKRCGHDATLPRINIAAARGSRCKWRDAPRPSAHWRRDLARPGRDV